MSSARVDESPAHPDRLLRRGLRLEYATLAWNVVGTAVVIAAAIRAGSVALAGFGLDSLIEIFASVIVVWQLTGADQSRERSALRLIAAAFLALSVYIVVQLAVTLATGTRPASSSLGIVWLVMTVVVMLVLSGAKHRTGRQLGNQVLISESRVTLVDAYLAAAVLVGVALNATFGLWWADPLASLVVVYYGIREAIEAWRHAATYQ